MYRRIEPIRQLQQRLTSKDGMKCQAPRTQPKIVTPQRTSNKNGPQHQPYARGTGTPSQIIQCPRSKTLIHLMNINNPSGAEVLAR